MIFLVRPSSGATTEKVSRIRAALPVRLKQVQLAARASARRPSRVSLPTPRISPAPGAPLPSWRRGLRVRPQPRGWRWRGGSSAASRRLFLSNRRPRARSCRRAARDRDRCSIRSDARRSAGRRATEYLPARCGCCGEFPRARRGLPVPDAPCIFTHPFVLGS